MIVINIPKPYYCVYRPDNEKALRKLAKQLGGKVGHLEGVLVYDDNKERSGYGKR